MSALSTLYVELRATTSKLSGDLNDGMRQLKAFEKDARGVTTVLTQMGQAATQMGKVLTVGLTAPIAAIAGLGLQFNAMQEQAQIAFTTMLGDGKKATAFLSELKDFAAKTPFEFPDLVKAAQRLMAMGFAAKDVKPLLTSVGDAVAGLGGGAPEINRVTLALGQMQGRGKVATQEMNQLTEVGIPAWKILADKFGIAETKLRDMVEKGVIPADKAIQALIEGMNEQFGGMTKKQAASFKGLMSTIKDESRFVSGELSEGLFNLVKGPMAEFASMLHNIRVRMDGWSDSTKAALAVLAGAGAVVGPALFAFGQMAQGISALILIGPKLIIGIQAMQAAITTFAAGLALGPGAIAVVVAVAAAALVTLTYKIAEATGVIDALASKIARWRGLMAETDAALAQNSKGVEQNIAWLKAHGVTVDRAGKSAEQLEQEVAKLTRQYLKVGSVAESAADAAKKHSLLLLESAEAVKKAAAEQAKWVSKMQDASDDIDAFYEKFGRSGVVIRNAMAPIGEFAVFATEAIASIGVEQLAFAKETAATFKAEADKAVEYSLFLAKSYLDVIGNAQKLSSKLAETGAKEMQDQANAGLDRLTKDWENKREIDRAQLDYQLDRHRKAAESYQRIWEQATANITSDFVKGFSDVIFHAKNFMQAMKDIALKTAESMFQAFMTGLVSPLTSAMSKLGRSLADAIMGKGVAGKSGIMDGLLGSGLKKLGGILGIGGATAGAAVAGPTMGLASLGTNAAEWMAGIGPATYTGAAALPGAAAATAPGAGLGASVIPFLTNPITLAVAGAIAAGFAIHHFVGQGRRAANEFVGNAERPFGQQLGAIVDSFDSMKKAGSLTLEQAKTARNSAQELWRSFLKSNAEFAAQGKTQAKVAEQSIEHLKEAFGPNLSKVFEGMDTTIAALQGNSGGPGGSGLPATGLVSSASTKFANGVDKLLEGIAAAVESVAPRNSITITNEFAPANTFYFYGVPESLQQQIRDQIEPQLLRDMEDNSRGITEKMKDILGL